MVFYIIVAVFVLFTLFDKRLSEVRHVNPEV